MKDMLLNEKDKSMKPPIIKNKIGDIIKIGDTISVSLGQGHHRLKGILRKIYISKKNIKYIGIKFTKASFAFKLNTYDIKKEN